MTPAYPRVPYGVGDFARIRRDGCLYVDKTRFVRRLEQQDYVFLIRPRRFGKTCWISLLEAYYDRTRADAFDALFSNTDIGAEPTANRSRYIVLRLDFSAFGAAPATLEARFEGYCRDEIRNLLSRNADLFSEQSARDILAPSTAVGILNRLFHHAAACGAPLYVLIDEYDNFANTVLAHRGRAAYEHVTGGDGFYRSFFAALKAGAARDGVIERLFVTGVSPITLDDVTSGFNIAANVSLDADFAEMLGFTEPEVAGLLEMYRGLGVFDQEVPEALATMREWYDGYRFSRRSVKSVYNPDMVLHYLMQSIPNRGIPDDLVDENVRIDYGKLRHLMVASRRESVRPNGNFDLLRRLVGEGRAATTIRRSFPLEQLAQRENFLSLLYYFGLLAIEGEQGGLTQLAIPNQTVRQLLYGYLREVYDEAELFSMDLHRLLVALNGMAFRGDWRPVIRLLGDAIAAQTGIRDYIAGEKTLQGFLAAYLGLAPFFLLRSEVELAKGYADLVLDPFLARHPDMRCGYVVELKYLKRGDADAASVASRSAHTLPPAVASALADARAQLRRYLSDPQLRAQNTGVGYVGLALVFHGWELVACEAVESG